MTTYAIHYTITTPIYGTSLHSKVSADEYYLANLWIAAIRRGWHVIIH